MGSLRKLDRFIGADLVSSLFYRRGGFWFEKANPKSRHGDSDYGIEVVEKGIRCVGNNIYS